MRQVTTVLFIAALVMSCAVSASSVTQCDRLASHPSDPDRVAAGVSSADVNHDEAIAACEEAVALDGGNARLNYQLGRVYFYSGRPKDALPLLNVAANKGYRQAQFVLGYVLTTSREGIPQDLCRAEQLWAASARAGRLASEVSYAQYAMRNRFEACPLSVNPMGIKSFLAAAGEKELDFYQRLLVTELNALWQERYEEQ